MGKGGGKAHTPREAKDNLKSTQMMSVIDAIGEGPIEGPVKGLQSILVNKTPLTDTDGNPVIHGVTAVWRAGEQEQTPPEGFESSGAETGLGVEVTKAKPVTRTITSANIDRLRVTFGVQSLLETTSKGDRNHSSVRLLIQLQRNGNWVTEKDVTINGKTTSQFLASVILDNLPPRPFNIRMGQGDGGQHHGPAAEQNAVVVIHRNHRCETVLPEHGHCGAAGGCGAVWRSADDGELPYPRSHHPGTVKL
ncbi:host specificity protein J [Escherichia coli DEC4B]|nr:host specificity protein J [Escherichia coli DEC4B]